ncbi:MAG: serine hydrolase domain-containing protein [Ferruginibacter sp.]
MIPAFRSLFTLVANQFCYFFLLCKEKNNLSFYRLSLYTTFFLCSLYVTACHSSSQPNQSLNKDTGAIQLPLPTALAEADKLHLQQACAAWYDTVLKNTSFNGGILVAKNGNVIFEKYRGAAHFSSIDSITALTPMHIASVSKTFTAMYILKLWQDKKLDLDDEYSKYFPTFNYPGVTIRTLLNHRSGLPNYLYFMEDLGWNKKSFIKNQDVLDYLITRKAELKNISRPNTHFTYCNTNYALLALLAEKISGSPFPELIKKTFFEPLRMAHSYIFTHADSATAIPSYDWRGHLIPLDFLDDVYGDKNVYTTPEDLLIWDRALSTNLIFSKETLEQAYAPYSNEKAGIRNYGLGWRMNIYPNGKKMIFHNGWWHGSNAAFIRLFQDDVTIILIGNKYCSTIYKAKNLSNIFNNYFEKDLEEDTEQKTLGDSLNTTPKKIIHKTHRR